MKTKYYTKLLFPLCLFCFIFRVLELAFSVELSDKTFFYKTGSIIPVMFNIYIGLCIVFFLTFWIWDMIKLSRSPELAAKKSEKKAAKSAGGNSEKENAESGKKNIILDSEFSRIKKLDGKTVLLYVGASILLLTYSIQLVFNELDINSVTYESFTDLFGTLVPYLFIAALFAVVFFVQFAASPKAASRGKFWMIISAAPAIFYTLLVFYTFNLHSGIISNVFATYDFIKIAALAIALICIPQLMISSNRRSLFFSSSLCAVFLSVLRLSDSFVQLLITVGAGDAVLPLSHLSGFDADHLLITADFLLSLALILTAVRLYRKPRKKTEPASDTVSVSDKGDTEN